MPTNSDKNVDFTIDLNSEEVYCEVKSPSWQSELSKKEKLGIRKAQGKYKKTKFGFLDIGKILEMQLKKLIHNF